MFLTFGKLLKWTLWNISTIYVGTSILWLSKVLTKNFHYNYVHNRYSDTAEMLLTDKDSLMYEIKAENVCEDF